MMTTLRQRFSLIGILLIALSLGINAFALWVQGRLSDQIASQYIALQAVRNHMEADMMHDALRADVYGALLASSDPTIADQKAVAADLAEHVAGFQDAIETNRKLALPAAVAETIGSVEQPLHAYIDAAQSTAGLAGTNRSNAVAAMPAFLDSFGQLEEQMGTVSDRIVAFATEVQKESDGIASYSRIALWSTLGITVAFFLALGLFAVRAIIAPLLRLTGTIRHLAAGDLEIQVEDMERGDEFGDMSRAVDQLRSGALEARRLRVAQIEQERVAEEQKNEALRRMAETVEQETHEAVDRISELTTRMAENAARMSRGAESVSKDCQGVSAAASQALSNARAVAAASEELSSSIREISAQVINARTASDSAVHTSDDAGRTITELSAAVDKISAVTSLISDIASQTNLLALNATIEAARAGEAGKGFAVVANEVKALATQTARATDEIAQQIDAVQRVTDRAVTAVKQIGNSIRSVESVSTAIAGAVEEQTATTSEIARSVGEASGASQMVAERISAVSGEADSTGRSAADVEAYSQKVSEGIQALRSILIRVVRTSTREVDRRRQPRYAVDWRATAEADGRTAEVTVENCSAGGALLRPASALPAAARRIELRIDKLGETLPAIVLAVRGDKVHVKFDLADAQREAFAKTFARLMEGRAPLAIAA